MTHETDAAAWAAALVLRAAALAMRALPRRGAAAPGGR